MELMLSKVNIPSVYVVRPFNVFALEGRADQVISKWKARIEEGKPIEYHGDLKRNYTYVGDIIEGVRELVNAPLKGYHTFDFGNPKSHSLKKLLDIFKKKYPKMKVIEKKVKDTQVSPEGNFACTIDFIELAKKII
jgi:nucleoside-diphosphate-sugar epimerase